MIINGKTHIRNTIFNIIDEIENLTSLINFFLAEIELLSIKRIRDLKITTINDIEDKDINTKGKIARFIKSIIEIIIWYS